MKLVPKLTAALVGGTLAVLVTNGYLRIQRETAALHADRESDQALLARSLGAAVTAVWRSGGPDEALQVVDGANARGGRVRVRWVDGELPAGAHADAGALSSLSSGDSITRIARVGPGEARFTYTPVFASGGRVGLIEISEPLDAEKRAVHGIVVDTVTLTLALTLLSAALSVVLGFWLVGRPVRALSKKARRIGEGDFSEPLALRSRDEFGVLASEMNAMCERLVLANERIERETVSRIKTLEQLRHADRLMTVGKLASGIAHELGTPLNVITARASMIAAGDATPAESVEYARIIADASGRMAKIIRQLLAFARRKPANKAPHDVARLAQDTLDLLRPLAQKKGIELVLRREQADATALVDAGEIQQAITNLVVNGMQAMSDAGAIEVMIEHETARTPSGGSSLSCLRVRVRDEGEGIAKENLVHVFEPFFTTKDVGEGTGLGLSVTHGIVEDHEGWITVESDGRKGSVFTMYLPVGEAS
jgi:signal transduction histidine kinase